MLSGYSWGQSGPLARGGGLWSAGPVGCNNKTCTEVARGPEKGTRNVLGSGTTLVPGGPQVLALAPSPAWKGLRFNSVS